MHDGALRAQISDGVEGFPVAVVVLPEERGEVEVQLDVQLVHQRGDLRIAHQGKEESPLHRGAVRKPAKSSGNIN